VLLSDRDLKAELASGGLALHPYDEARVQDERLVDDRLDQFGQVAVRPTASVPVRCIQVAAPSGMFLVGRTHLRTDAQQFAPAGAPYGAAGARHHDSCRRRPAGAARRTATPVDYRHMQHETESEVPSDGRSHDQPRTRPPCRLSPKELASLVEIADSARKHGVPDDDNQARRV
jgi:hypothetical protein